MEKREMDIFWVVLEIVKWVVLGTVCLNILFLLYIVAEGKGMPTFHQSMLCLWIGVPYLLYVLLRCECRALHIAWKSHDILHGRRIFPR